METSEIKKIERKVKRDLIAKYRKKERKIIEDMITTKGCEIVKLMIEAYKFDCDHLYHIGELYIKLREVKRIPIMFNWKPTQIEYFKWLFLDVLDLNFVSRIMSNEHEILCSDEEVYDKCLQLGKMLSTELASKSNDDIDKILHEYI